MERGTVSYFLSLAPPEIQQRKAVKAAFNPAVSAEMVLRSPSKRRHPPDMRPDYQYVDEARGLVHDSLQVVGRVMNEAVASVDPECIVDTLVVFKAMDSSGRRADLAAMGSSNLLWAIGAAGKGGTIDRLPEVFRLFSQYQALTVLANYLHDSAVEPSINVANHNERLARSGAVVFRCQWIGRKLMSGLASSGSSVLKANVALDACDFATWISFVDRTDKAVVESYELTEDLKAYLRSVSVAAGSRSDSDIWQLIESRDWMTHPVIDFGSVLFPASIRTFALLPYIPAIDLLKRTPGGDAGRAFEVAVASVLPKACDDRVIAGGCRAPVSKQDPGEIDVVALGGDSWLMVVECKSEGLQNIVDATATAFAESVAKAAEQLRRRLGSVAAAGVVQEGSTWIDVSRRKAIGVVVTQHEYGGVIWNGPLVAEILGSADITVLCVHDLALIGYLMASVVEMCDYLAWRTKHLPSLIAVDETDLLHAYFNSERIVSRLVDDGVSILTPTALDPALRSGCEPPTTPAELREALLRARVLPAFRPD